MGSRIRGYNSRQFTDNMIFYKERTIWLFGIEIPPGNNKKTQGR